MLFRSDDWVDALAQFSQKSVEQALSSHVTSSPTVKPTPAMIREKAKSFEGAGGPGKGDRDGLNMDEQFNLIEKVLPTAKRWVRDFPPRHPLYEHGMATLNYWGEAA